MQWMMDCKITWATATALTTRDWGNHRQSRSRGRNLNNESRHLYVWYRLDAIEKSDLWGPPNLLFSGYRSTFRGVKRPGLEVNHSPPRSGELKNEWRDSAPPPTWPHGMDRESSWNVMAHGDAREGKWRGNCRMEWVASTLHTTSEHGVSSFTTTVARTSAASSRLNWRPRRFKWTRPFRRKTKSGFCACAVLPVTTRDRRVPEWHCHAIRDVYFTFLSKVF
jgi:hypothetical protein